ncbi:MAG: hypothetical protein V7L05_30935 [Nostoc sp.]|uniref:hypothetical protein n=1 Tax=Nostoc sp. TaxID=1180 RepID=UPI002FF73951
MGSRERMTMPHIQCPIPIFATFHVPFPLFACSVGFAHSTFLLNNEPQRRRGHREMRVKKISQN